MLALLLSYILLLAYYYDDITLRGNADNFSFLNKIKIKIIFTTQGGGEMLPLLSTGTAKINTK